MGYRVVYTAVKTPSRRGSRAARVAVLTGAFLLLFLFLVNGFWPRGKQALQELLLPGNAAVTAAALEELAAELGEGEELSAALEEFCRRVIRDVDMDPD